MKYILKIKNTNSKLMPPKTQKNDKKGMKAKHNSCQIQALAVSGEILIN